MIEANATVLETGGGFALVEAQRGIGCGNCHRVATCTTGALMRASGTRSTRIKVVDPVGAEPGDAVVIGVCDGAVLRASAAVYLAPVALVVVGALTGAATVSGDAGSVAGAAAGLVLGFVWLRLYNSRRAGKPEFRPHIVRKTGRRQS